MTAEARLRIPLTQRRRSDAVFSINLRWYDLQVNSNKQQTINKNQTIGTSQNSKHKFTEHVQTLNISSSVTAKVRSSVTDNWLNSFWTSLVSIRIYSKKTKDEMRRGSILTINHGLNKKEAYYNKTAMTSFCVTATVQDNHQPCWFLPSVSWCFRQFPGYAECTLTGSHLCSWSHIQQPQRKKTNGDIRERVHSSVAGVKSLPCYIPQTRKGPGKRGHIVADTKVSPFARACNICCGRNTKTVSDFVQKHFVSVLNVYQFAQPKKHHGQQCVRNNVSSFTRALKARLHN